MIRRYKDTDREQVMGLWLNGNLQAHPFIPQSYWQSHFSQVGEQLGQAEVFVWEEEGKIKGFAGLMDSYIAGIFVDQAYRSQGIGKKLLDYLKEHREELSLNVYRKNERARKFYEREGFAVAAEGTDEDTGEEELRMRFFDHGRG